jgi:hypothetical protein
MECAKDARLHSRKYGCHCPATSDVTMNAAAHRGGGGAACSGVTELPAVGHTHTHTHTQSASYFAPWLRYVHCSVLTATQTQQCCCTTGNCCSPTATATCNTPCPPAQYLYCNAILLVHDSLLAIVNYNLTQNRTLFVYSTVTQCNVM